MLQSAAADMTPPKGGHCYLLLCLLLSVAVWHLLLALADHGSKQLQTLAKTLLVGSTSLSK